MRRTHPPDQGVRKLRKADRLLAENKDVPEIAKHLEISKKTRHGGASSFGGLKTDDAKRLLEIDALREVAKERRNPPKGSGERCRRRGQRVRGIVAPSKDNGRPP